MHELTHNRPLSSHDLAKVREQGGLSIDCTLTTDAESVYKSLTSRDLKTPAEKTLLGHVAWVRELLSASVLRRIRWCDTRDMTADGHTKGSIPRDGLLGVMRGMYGFTHPVKTYMLSKQAAARTDRGST